MKKTILTILIFSVFSLFLYRGLLYLDPDFGWHVRMGEIIRHSGIPKTDPFSYTMPSYPFVDHEWLSNMFISILYPATGKIGLSVLFAMFGTTALLLPFFVSQAPKNKIGYIFIVFAAIILLPFVGVRTQVETWIFFSVLISILSSHTLRYRFRFFLPILFLFWVNMHGGFAVGIVALIVFFIVDTYTTRKINKVNLLVLLLSIAVTGMTPYGYRIWWEVWMQMSDSSLRWSITEWMPALFFPEHFVLWFYFVISLIFGIRYRRRVSLITKTFYIGLLCSGLSSIRQIPLWIFISLPLTIESFYWFSEEVKNYKGGLARFRVVYQVFIVVSISLVIAQIYLDYQSNILYSENAFYPVGEVQYLYTHKIKGNVYSIYDWGGYLDWKLPEKKVFIDGRMPSWRWKAPNIHESSYAFQDYQKVFSDPKTFTKTLKKYNITVLLLPFGLEQVNKHTPRWITFINGLDAYVFRKKQQKPMDIQKEIKKNGFKKIYSGTQATIYVLK